jgi:phosphohistidine phosphatase
MDLVLWRHAEAIDVELAADDFGRALTVRGEKQAARMADWLDRQMPAGAKVWCSPTLRTEQTARALGRKFKSSAAIGPQGTVEQLLELAQWPQGKGCVLIIGHQPVLGQTVSRLMGLTASQCAVRKGAVWWFRLREREEGAQTTLLTVQSVDLL